MHGGLYLTEAGFGGSFGGSFGEALPSSPVEQRLQRVAFGSASRPTIADVAAHCGVSKAAVSKALSPRPEACDLAPATKQRILQKAIELGYAPDARARAKARRRFQRIGLLYGTRIPIFFSLFEGFADGLSDALAQRGYDLIFLPAVTGIQDWECATCDSTVSSSLIRCRRIWPRSFPPRVCPWCSSTITSICP